MVTDSSDFSDPIQELINECGESLSAVSHLLFTTTLRILQEAGSCHRNQCYVASCTMCRGAVESILNTFKVWRRNGSRYTITGTSKSKLSHLIKWAKGEDILDDETEKLAKDVAEKGDLSAHFAQRLDSARSEQRAAAHGIWVKKEESLDTLKKTIKLLIRVAPLGYAKMEEKLSEPAE